MDANGHEFGRSGISVTLRMRGLVVAMWIVALAGMTALRGDELTTLQAGHPRLLVKPGGFARLVELAKHDPVRARLHARVVECAELLLADSPIEYLLVGPRMLDQSRKALGHVTTSALAYRLTGEDRFRRHARDVMLRAAEFPDWNPSHFLDVAEMATALALGYDWLHDTLTEAERAAIEQALRQKSLAYVAPAYGRRDKERISFPFVAGNEKNNWNQVCNGGFLLSALALADREPVLARAVLDGLRDTLPQAMAAYEPDGAYPEGPVYWSYGTRYNVLILAALESALGHDLGLGRRPGFSRTALFRLHVQSPTGLSFNFADGRAHLGADPALTWLAAQANLPVAMALSRRLLLDLLDQPPDMKERFLAMHALWFPEDPGAGTARPARDVAFDGPSRLALFRSAWDDPAALWTGLKAGSNRVNHGHLDAGSFMLDADGVRWAVDLGPDGYNLPGYWDGATVDSPRWAYFRLNNRSHNTITPGTRRQSPDADVPWEAFASTEAAAYAITDLRSAYPDDAAGFRRGVVMLDRSRVLVQDEVTGLRPGTPLIWQMLTPASVAIEGSRAVLSREGRTLRIEALSPVRATWTVRAATPPTAVEMQNDGIQVLSLTVPAEAAVRDVRIVVVLSPVGPKWPVLPVPVIRPLDAWAKDFR
ncbi:MAG: heparinase II/III family protein [Opitutaceae bacterium]